jgi:ATP-dependent DNA helicase Q4
VDVLFVSPERLRSDSFIRLIQNQILPPISFVCVDEVHCISEWSHNFRTSYLHLHSSLLDTLNVGCILGLTGTATVSSQESICTMLKITRPDGIVSHGFLRDNLKLSVEILDDSAKREEALLELIRSEPYDKLKSIIVYVMFQNQADQLAQYLRIRNLDAESYHAGRPPEIRSEIQSRFLKGKLRILTATVAFGMGINKSDIDAVIHYTLPKSVENYVQETGRAGRDGRESLCRLFLAREDYIKHRSFVYSESVDTAELMKFLKMLFSEDGPVVGLTMSDCEKQYDIKEGVISTILSYIELSRPDILQIMPVTSSTVVLYFVQGTTIEDLCKEHEWFWNIHSSSRKSKGGIEFDVISVFRI